ncbi:MAG: hypothetical protein HUJ86_05050 [Synergistes sp.]|nr:hypothetical protein [Synergistes sp.]
MKKFEIGVKQTASDAAAEVLLASASGRELGRMKSIVFALIAAYLFLSGGWLIFHHGETQKILMNIGLGFCALAVVKYVKKVYVSPIGFVKETHTWFSHHREILPWSDVKSVTINVRGQNMMALIERDIVGWKLFFYKNEKEKLKSILKEYVPNVPINDLSPRYDG